MLREDNLSTSGGVCPQLTCSFPGITPISSKFFALLTTDFRCSSSSRHGVGRLVE